MFPVISTPIGPLSAYAACTAAGFALAAVWVLAAHRRRGFTVETTFFLTIVAAASGLAGARGWFVLTHLEIFTPWLAAFRRAPMDLTAGCVGAALPPAALLLYARPWVFSLRAAAPVVLLAAAGIGFLLSARLAGAHALSPDLDPFDPSGGGQSSFGALLLATPTVLFAASRYGIPPGVAADSAAPGVLAALSVGRLGCILNGCCPGIPASHAVSVGGRVPAAAIEGVAVGALAIIAALRTPAHLSGRFASALALAYAAVRFLCECLRADRETGVGSLSMNQSAAVALAALAVLSIALVPGPRRAETG